MNDEPLRVTLRRIERKLDTLLRVIGKTTPPLRKSREIDDLPLTHV